MFEKCDANCPAAAKFVTYLPSGRSVQMCAHHANAARFQAGAITVPISPPETVLPPLVETWNAQIQAMGEGYPVDEKGELIMPEPVRKFEFPVGKAQKRRLPPGYGRPGHPGFRG